MQSRNLFSLLTVLSLVFVANAFAEQNSVKRYTLHAYGEIEFTIPADWKDEIQRPPNNLPSTIRFTAPGDKSMAMLVTLLWPDNPDKPMPDASWMKAKLEQAKKGIQQQAVEDSIPTRQFSGREGDGYYFTATNSTPKENGFKHMTHGMLRIGGILASFTILNNEGYQAMATRGLTVLQNAVHHQAKKPGR